MGNLWLTKLAPNRLPLCKIIYNPRLTVLLSETFCQRKFHAMKHLCACDKMFESVQQYANRALLSYGLEQQNSVRMTLYLCKLKPLATLYTNASCT